MFCTVYLKAGSDDKYIVVKVDGENTHKLDLADYRTEDKAVALGHNKDGDTVRLSQYEGAALGTAWGGDYYLVNTSGSIVKNKTAAKDGNDWYFYVEKQNIKMYVNNKTLKNGTGTNAGDIPETTLKKLDAWKTWPAAAAE